MCLNVGCIFIKIYFKNVEILDGLKVVVGCGINFVLINYVIDMDKIVVFKNFVVKILIGGVCGFLKVNKVEIFNGFG